MLELLKDIKFAIGVLSTIALILSAFRFEVLNSDDENYFDDNLVIDKNILDALARFDRNVRHLQLKGKETGKNDCMNILPDFKDAIQAASKITREYKKLLSSNRDNGDKKRSKHPKRWKNDKTLSYSLQFGKKIYVMSFYWPKLLEVFLGSSAVD